MKTFRFIAISVATFIILSPSPSHALHCGRKLINVGIHKNSAVPTIDRCGEILSESVESILISPGLWERVETVYAKIEGYCYYLNPAR